MDMLVDFFGRMARKLWAWLTTASWGRRQTDAMRRGIRLEPVVFARLLEMGYPVERCPKLHTMEFECDGRTHSVFGRVDGVIRDEDGRIDTVVEIKNRVNRFFVPDYDVDQLAAYVVMTDARKGMLAQMFDGRIQITTFGRRELQIRWSKMVDSLRPAIRYMDAMAKDTSYA